MRLVAGMCALALTALPALGQSGIGSDFTGPGVTDGGIAGLVRRGDNAVFRTRNGAVTWVSSEVACAVTGAAPAVEQALREGPLSARPETGEASVADSAREALWGVMRGDSVDRTDATEALASQLRGSTGPDTRLGRRARVLATALGGLLGRLAPCPAPEDQRTAGAWEEAVGAYERYLDARPRGADPGDAVLGVHAVLTTFMQAALAAAGAAR